MSEERCCECDSQTGKAGVQDDSLYDNYGNGPYCDTCYETTLEYHEAHSKDLKKQNAALRELCGEMAGYGKVLILMAPSKDKLNPAEQDCIIRMELLINRQEELTKVERGNYESIY